MNPALRIRSLLGRVLAGLCVVLVSAPLFAEVSVITDTSGIYLRTLVLTEARGNGRLIWSQVRRGVVPSALLNVDGDLKGDSNPIVLEQPGRRQPWAVWTTSDGHDREIAFATWAQGHWLGPQLLERLDNPYDDLNPRLAFDSTGSPVVV